MQIYSEALAGKLGWRTLTPAQWAVLEAEREIAMAPGPEQRELFGSPAEPPRQSPAIAPEAGPPPSAQPKAVPNINRLFERRLA